MFLQVIESMPIAECIMSIPIYGGKHTSTIFVYNLVVCFLPIVDSFYLISQYILYFITCSCFFLMYSFHLSQTYSSMLRYFTVLASSKCSFICKNSCILKQYTPFSCLFKDSVHYMGLVSRLQVDIGFLVTAVNQISTGPRTAL